MTTLTALDLQRQFFAEEIEAVARLKTPALVAALAAVPRERFLPPGPWTTLGDVDFVAGGITGSPASLPAGWVLRSGWLIGPSVFLDHDNLNGVKLSGTDMAGAETSWSTFTGANLSGADLAGSLIEDSDFTNADLAGSDLFGASLGGDTWTDATCPNGPAPAVMAAAAREREPSASPGSSHPNRAARSRSPPGRSPPRSRSPPTGRWPTPPAASARAR